MEKGKRAREERICQKGTGSWAANNCEVKLGRRGREWQQGASSRWPCRGQGNRSTVRLCQPDNAFTVRDGNPRLLLGLSGRQGKLEAIPACSPVRQTAAQSGRAMPVGALGWRRDFTSAPLLPPSTGLDPDHLRPTHSSSSEPVFGFLSVPNRLLRLTNIYTPVGAQPLPQAGVGFCAHTYLLVIRMSQSRLSRASPSAAFALGVALGRSRLARLGARQLDRSGHASTSRCFSSSQSR